MFKTGKGHLFPEGLLHAVVVRARLSAALHGCVACKEALPLELREQEHFHHRKKHCRL